MPLRVRNARRAFTGIKLVSIAELNKKNQIFICQQENKAKGCFSFILIERTFAGVSFAEWCEVRKL